MIRPDFQDLSAFFKAKKFEIGLIVNSSIRIKYKKKSTKLGSRQIQHLNHDKS